MRLTSLQVKQINDSLKKNLADADYELYLHGSRIDDNRAGGDIDLFLIVADSKFQEILLKKHYLLAAIKMTIGDQRIDLNIMSKMESRTNEFFIQSEKVRI